MWNHNRLCLRGNAFCAVERRRLSDDKEEEEDLSFFLFRDDVNDVNDGDAKEDFEETQKEEWKRGHPGRTSVSN